MQRYHLRATRFTGCWILRSQLLPSRLSVLLSSSMIQRRKIHKVAGAESPIILQNSRYDNARKKRQINTENLQDAQINETNAIQTRQKGAQIHPPYKKCKDPGRQTSALVESYDPYDVTIYINIYIPGI